MYLQKLKKEKKEVSSRKHSHSRSNDRINISDNIRQIEMRWKQRVKAVIDGERFEPGAEACSTYPCR